MPPPQLPTAVPPVPAPTGVPGTTGATGTRAEREPYDRDLLARRYGARRADELLSLVEGRRPPSRRARPAVVLTVVLLAVVATWAVWAWRSATTGAVTADLLGFDDPTSDTSLVVSWSVSRDPGTTVTCQVTATDRSGADVGIREVTVAPRGDRTTQLVTDVRTRARAANASVGGCRTVPVASSSAAPTAR